MSITNRQNVPRGERQRERRGDHTCNQLFYHCDTNPAEEEKNREEGEEEEREKKGAKIKTTRKSAKAKHEFLVSGGREIWTSTSWLSSSILFVALGEKAP